jgi:Flp pilus assembly protein TadG
MNARWDRKRRSGVSTIEMALVLPMLLMLVLGGLDYGLQFYAWDVMGDAARDAAREAAVRDGTAAQAQAVAVQRLSGLHGAFAITVTMPTGTSTDVTVHISVPVSDVSLGYFHSGRTIETSVTMRKENG